MVDMQNVDVLEYLNRFIRCRDIKIEDACRLKIVNEVCSEYEKKGDKENETRCN